MQTREQFETRTSAEESWTPTTPVPAWALAGIGLLGLLLALFGSRAGLNDRRRALVALACLAPIVGLSLPVAAQAQTKVPSDWSLIPAGINPGDSFRLIFGSSTERNGTSTDIATYNTWIQARAAAGHTAIRAYSSGFRVVGSTSAVHARDNTETTYTSADKGVPIYWLGGSKVADDYEDFYDGSWDNETDPKDESGSARDLDGTNDHPMTGSTHAGTKSSGFALGSSSVILGKPNSSASADGPLSSNNATAKTNTRPFYGLSAVFTVQRPPAALSITDASAAENAGHLLFDVTLSRSLPNTVKVDFETISGGTATEGDDYHARRTYTHVILAGDRTAQMGFALIEDMVNDADETVKVRLSNAREVDAYGDKIADLDITPDEATGTITAPATTTTNVPNLNIRIQDATGDEDDGWLVFKVKLSRKYDKYVCYDFETISGGTATEGTDYSKRPKVGQWTQIRKRVDKPFVRIIDDSVNDDGETVKVKISNARLCNDASQTVSITRAEATGTITNSDHMPQAWMVRFGRTVGSQAVDALGQRLDGGTGSHVTVGGINLTGAPGAVPEAQSYDPFGLPEWAKGTQREESEQSLTANELLLGSAFHLSSGGGQSGGAAYTAWGRVARSEFEAEVDDGTMDGDVTSGLIGFDAEWERVLAGVMLSQSSGEGSYGLSAENGAKAGTVESSLTGVYPYARLELNRQVSAWALAGMGSGELTLQHEGEKPMPTDITMRMGAVGFKGQVLNGTGASGLAVNVKSDAMWMGTKSERTSDMVATQGDVTRLRLIVEGERAFTLAVGGTFTPSAQLGLRHDGGDAETGTGVEVGAGLRYTVDSVTVEAEARTLVAHEDSAYKEWGASAAIRVTPDASGRGLTLSIAPTWGQTGSGAQRLWSARDASGLGTDSEFEARSRLDINAGYGFGLRHSRSVLTPYAGFTLGDGGARTMRTGTRWQLTPDAVFGLEGTRRADSAGEGESEVRLRAALRF